MAINIGALFASLTLQSDQFTRGTRDAANAAQNMSKKIDGAFGAAKAAAVGFLGALSVQAIFDITKAGLDYASSLGEVAQQLGTTTGFLQEMRYAASQVGVSTEDMDKAIGKLTLTVGKAADGNKGLQESFGKLGVSLSDLKNMNTEQVLLAMADGLENIKDPATRAALEVEFLGKTGQKLDTLLAGGSEAINELAKQANALGLILSDEEIQNADKTADKIAELQMVLQMRVASVVAQNADAIFQLASAMANLAGTLARLWSQDPEKLYAVLGALAGLSVGGPVGAVLGGGAGFIGGLLQGDDGAMDVKFRGQKFREAKSSWERMRANPNQNPGQVRSAEKELRKQMGLYRKALDRKDASDALNLNNPGAGPRDIKVPGGRGPRSNRGGGRGAGGGRDPLERAREVLADLKFEEEQLGRTSQEQEIYNKLKQAGVSETSELGKQIADLTGKLSAAKALKDYNDGLADMVRDSKDATAAIGLQGRALAELQLRQQFARNRPKTPSTAGADGAIVVTAPKMSPEEQEAWDAMQAQQTRMHEQRIADLDFERQQLGRTSTEQAIYNELRSRGLDLYSREGQEIAGKVIALDAERDRLKKLAEEQQRINDIANEFGNIGVNMLDGLIQGTESWQDVFSNAIHSLGQLMLEELVYKPIKEMIVQFAKTAIFRMIGGIGGGSYMSGGLSVTNAQRGVLYPTVGMANGGSAEAGKPYWIGERGPELFRPSSNGMIVPAHRAQNSGGNTFIVNAQGSTNPAETKKLVGEALIAALPMINQQSHAYTMGKLTRPRM